MKICTARDYINIYIEIMFKTQVGEFYFTENTELYRDKTQSTSVFNPHASF